MEAPVINSRTTICVLERLKIVPFPTNVLPKKIWSIAPPSKLEPLIVHVNVLGETEVGLMDVIWGGATTVKVRAEE